MLGFRRKKNESVGTMSVSILGIPICYDSNSSTPSPSLLRPPASQPCTSNTDMQGKKEIDHLEYLTTGRGTWKGNEINVIHYSMAIFLPIAVHLCSLLRLPPSPPLAYVKRKAERERGCRSSRSCVPFLPQMGSSQLHSAAAPLCFPPSKDAQEEEKAMCGIA